MRAWVAFSLITPARAIPTIGFVMYDDSDGVMKKPALFNVGLQVSLLGDPATRWGV